MKMLKNIKAAQAANKITAIKLIAVFFLCGSSFNAAAQATVRDSSPVSVAPAARATGADAAQGQATDYHLIQQIQQLQQEISELRGMLEEQGFQLKRLKQQRLDDYLDLDKRLGELSQKQAGSSSSQAATTANSGLASLSNTAVPNTAAASANQSEEEKQLYRTAIDQLLSKQDYPGAQASFNQYLKQYPEGTYVPNVHYWQGQIYLTDSNKKAAQQSFSTLLKNYPDHPKAPDAKYKLATIYYDQGKKTEAKKMLDEVAASNSDASRLAKAFLANQY